MANGGEIKKSGSVTAPEPKKAPKFEPLDGPGDKNPASNAKAELQAAYLQLEVLEKNLGRDMGEEQAPASAPKPPPYEAQGPSAWSRIWRGMAWGVATIGHPGAVLLNHFLTQRRLDASNIRAVAHRAPNGSAVVEEEPLRKELLSKSDRYRQQSDELKALTFAILCERVRSQVGTTRLIETGDLFFLTPQEVNDAADYAERLVSVMPSLNLRDKIRRGTAAEKTWVNARDMNNVRALKSVGIDVDNLVKRMISQRKNEILEVLRRVEKKGAGSKAGAAPRPGGDKAPSRRAAPRSKTGVSNDEIG